MEQKMNHKELEPTVFEMLQDIREEELDNMILELCLRKRGSPQTWEIYDSPEGEESNESKTRRME